MVREGHTVLRGGCILRWALQRDGLDVLLLLLQNQLMVGNLVRR